jgi:hypothetical protein
MRKQRGLFGFGFMKSKNNSYLDFFQEENIILNIQNLMKKILNVLQQFHQLKINQEHFHIGLFILHGDVRLIK